MTLPKTAQLRLATPRIFLDDGPSPKEEDESLAMWLLDARLRREALVAEFDQILLRGGDAAAMALEIIEGFMDWTRRTVARFVRAELALPCGPMLRAQERRLWGDLARRNAELACAEPECLDRFLDTWLSLLHESVRTGFGTLFVAPGT